MSEKFTWRSNALAVYTYDNSHDAALAGFSAADDYKHAVPVRIVTAVLVKDGTKAHDASIDLVLEDERGCRYVTIITSNLLGTIWGISHA